MDLLKQAGALLGWLSGVVAGLSVIVFSLGYVATLSQQRVLGIDWSVTARDPLWFLGLGGLVVYEFLSHALIVLLLVLLAGESARSIYRRARARADTRDTRPGWWTRLLVLFGERIMPWALAIAGLAIIGTLSRTMNAVADLTDLLFLPPETLCAPRDALLRNYVTAREAALAVTYEQVATWSSLVLGLNVYLFEHLKAGPRPAVLVLTAIATTVVAVVYLPLAHGALAMRLGFHEVALGPRGGGAPAGQEVMAEGYLLARTQDGVWIWRPATNRVLWIGEGEFGQMGTGLRVSIHEVRCGADQPDETANRKG